MKKRSTLREFWWDITIIFRQPKIFRRLWKAWRSSRGMGVALQVDLRNLKLKSVPFLLYFIKTHSIYLSRNRLTKLPQWLKRKSNVEFIDLANNRFTEIPFILYEMPKLTEIHIGKNDLKAIPKDLLKKKDTLRGLSVPYCNLSELPDFICNFPNLSYLDIEGNERITEFPNQIGNLKHLSNLYFNHTNIKILPKSILNIDLVTNPLFEERFRHITPVGFSDYAHPYFLRWNPFSFPENHFIVPDHIKRLADHHIIKYLVASDEEKANFKTTYWKQRLKGSANNISLTVNSENIKYIDWKLFVNSNIKKITLGTDHFKNTISTFPKGICSLQQLTTLEIKNTVITVLPECIGQLTNLKQFTLNNNELTHLPDSFITLNKLKNIWIYNEPLEALPKEFGNPEKNSHFPLLTSMSIINGKLRQLPNGFSNLNKLTYLNLSHNQLQTINNSLGILTALRELHLEYNQLTTLPNNIAAYTQLFYLHLEYNQLKTLPAGFYQLKGVGHVHLEGNQLVELSEDISNMKRLVHLNLEHNQLKHLPESMAQLPSLSGLKLYQNPLESFPQSFEVFTKKRYFSLTISAQHFPFEVAFNKKQKGQNHIKRILKAQAAYWKEQEK